MAAKETCFTDPSNYVNRELSWLEFDHRVLGEARDKTTPLFDRLKFLSITASNLDEFFMVRVGSLVDLATVSPDEVDNKTGQTPDQQLKAIYDTIPSLIEINSHEQNLKSVVIARDSGHG